MIKSLYIKNFILIDELKLDFEAGFNAICGETGAGKSIIIKAIDTVLGAKISKDTIKNGPSAGADGAGGQNTALLEAVFDDCGKEVVVSREMTPSANKFRVDGALVNIEYIKELSEKLIDIHSQHQTYTYLQKKFHIQLLDEFISANSPQFKGDLAQFEADFLESRQTLTRIEKIEQNNSENATRAEFLKFQINEIQSAEILAGEEEQLRAELEVLSNVVELKESSYAAFWALSGDETSVSAALSKIQAVISRAASADKKLSQIEESFIEGAENLKYCADELRRYNENLSDDPKRLDEINERLSLIEKLKRKYGVLDEALEKFSAELRGIEVDTNELNDLKIRLDELQGILNETSAIISEERRVCAKELSGKILGELRKLELEHSDFEIRVMPLAANALSTPAVAMNKQGADDVEFLITTNVSQPLAPLTKVASGGELSRVMLAIKSVFARKECGAAPLGDASKAIIFDEIDTGISGRTSQAVATAIADLSSAIQIFAITHQPIIASKAKNLYWVEKTQSGQETKVRAAKLTEAQIPRALAQLASGEITETSLTFVKDLLNL